MKKVILFSMLCVFSAMSVLAQSNEQLVLKKKHYYQNDKKLNSKDIKSILLSDPESAVEYQIAKKNSTIAAVPMLAGTALCLYGSFASLKSSIDQTNALNNGEYYEEKSYVAPVLLGAGLVLVGIPFVLSSNKHLKKSITIYNKNQTTGFHNIQKLEFGLTQNGIGVTYHF
jgi:hypothetical protein